MKTRNGVYLDINKSHYRFKPSGTSIILVFSSDYYRTKFEDNYIKHREEFNLRLKNRYHVNVDFKTYPDIVLYKKIEKRGFLVHEGDEKICQESLLLAGEQLTNKD